MNSQSRLPFSKTLRVVYLCLVSTGVLVLASCGADTPGDNAAVDTLVGDASAATAVLDTSPVAAGSATQIVNLSGADAEIACRAAMQLPAASDTVAALAKVMLSGEDNCVIALVDSLASHASSGSVESARALSELAGIADGYASEAISDALINVLDADPSTLYAALGNDSAAVSELIVAGIRADFQKPTRVLKGGYKLSSADLNRWLPDLVQRTGSNKEAQNWVLTTVASARRGFVGK